MYFLYSLRVHSTLRLHAKRVHLSVYLTACLPIYPSGCAHVSVSKRCGLTVHHSCTVFHYSSHLTLNIVFCQFISGFQRPLNTQWMGNQSNVMTCNTHQSSHKHPVYKQPQLNPRTSRLFCYEWKEGTTRKILITIHCNQEHQEILAFNLFCSIFLLTFPQNTNLMYPRHSYSAFGSNARTPLPPSCKSVLDTQAFKAVNAVTIDLLSTGQSQKEYEGETRRVVAWQDKRQADCLLLVIILDLYC